MSIQDKRVRELTKIFNNNNNKIISKAIKSLRNEKPFYGAVGLLAEHYDKTDDPFVRNLIRNFMNDLKERRIKEEVIAEIQNVHKDDTINMLISSCWQSGQDYSEYGKELAAIFLNESYITAFECLTVIQESVQYMSKEKKIEIIELIEKNSDTVTDEKKALTLELLSILK